MGFGCSRFRVVIYLKTLVQGANLGANQGPVFFLEVADNAAMTTNLTLLDFCPAYNIGSGVEVQCFELTGCVPVAQKQYCRITTDPTAMGVGSSGVYDAVIEATP